MEYGKALPIVQGMVEQLRPYCERIEIAGSLRRGKSAVKDGEIVAIPKPGLLAYVDEMVAHGGIDKAVYGDKQTYRWGPLYRGMQVGEIKVELFLATEDNWGYQWWLRTGPAEANTWIMKYLSMKKAPVRARDGYWWWGDKKLRITSEEELFTLLGMPFVPPPGRTEQRYKQLIQWNKNHKWPDFNPFVILTVEPTHPDQAALPGMEIRRWGFDDPEPVSESEREKRFEAEMVYWQRLPVTTRMWVNHAQEVIRPDPLLIQPEKLLPCADFVHIRDEMALASETARLPVLLERCTELHGKIESLRSQIEVFRPKLQILDWIIQWPEVNRRELSAKRHELTNRRRALEEEKLELYRKLQPLDADYRLIQADIPLRLKRLGIAQQVEDEIGQVSPEAISA